MIAWVAMALLTAKNPVEIRPSELPLVVTQADYDSKRSAVVFSVRNDGSAPIIAWSVGMTWGDPGARPTSGTFIIDAYEHAAGFKVVPATNRVLAPGEMAQGFFVIFTRPGAARPRVMEVQTRAVVLEDNEALGDSASIRWIFDRRKGWLVAWTEVRSLLDTPHSSSTGGTKEFDRVIDALKSRESKKNFVGEASRTCLRALLAASEADRPRALETLAEEVQRRIDAAERFATSAAGKRD